MRHRTVKLALGIGIAAAAAGGVRADVRMDSRPDYLALRERTIALARQNIEDLGKGWKPQMTCMPKYGVIWQWDSCFMSLFAGYAPAGCDGLGNLDNLYSMQDESGFISMAYRYSTRKPAWGERINPPLYAWCEWLYARRTGDRSRLPRAYEVCVKYFNWLKANRTRPSNGLYWFEDTGSSGMDNSPRCGYYAEHKKGSDVCFVDLSCQQVLHARCLARIAPLVGKPEEAAGWNREADALAEKINDLMWCEKTGFYHDIYIQTNNKLAVKTVAAFWALVSGVATPARAARLVGHLFSGNEERPADFETYGGVPSLSADDPNYDPLGGYWLGGIWPPIQYMVCCGLRETGYRALARRIAMRHLDAMCATSFGDEDGSFETNTIWECYSPEAPAPSTDKVGRHVRKDFVGWGGLGPLVMLVEDVLGLDVNALDGRIDWYLSSPGPQGVTDLPFNGGKVSVEADVRAATGSFKARVVTDRPLRLRLISPDGRWRVVRDLAPGTSDFDSTKGEKN